MFSFSFNYEEFNVSNTFDYKYLSPFISLSLTLLWCKEKVTCYYHHHHDAICPSIRSSPFRIKNLVQKHCLRFSRAIDREWAEVHRSIIESSLGRSFRVRLSIAFVSPRTLQVPSHALTNRDVKQMSRSTIQTMFPPKMSLSSNTFPVSASQKNPIHSSVIKLVSAVFT